MTMPTFHEREDIEQQMADDKRLGHILKLVPQSQRELFISELATWIFNHDQRIEKAYGGCRKCYGKGYATTIDYQTASADFIGDKTSVQQNDIMRYCDCPRGEQLKQLIGRAKK